MEDGVVFVWGEYQGTLSKPGLYCLVRKLLDLVLTAKNPNGREIKTITRQKQSLRLPTTKIVDKMYTPFSKLLTFAVVTL